jgi:integrase/recombinase XerD
MNLSQGIESYVLRNRRAGLVCEDSAGIFKAFLKAVGDIPLEKISTEDVQDFLDSSDASATTWRIKHSKLRRFFEHWSWRGEMPILSLPTLRPAVRRTFVPYIYAKSQIRSLLAATKSSHDYPNCKADGAAFRIFILMLYATGARYSEILNIRREDIAFEQSRLTLRGTGRRPPRCIPIGADLKRELQKYLKSRNHPPHRGEIIFQSKSGAPISRLYFSLGFKRVRQVAGITREDSRYSPRLQDLRFTFAVHRITSWIRSSGADLNRLLPALSTYMGNASLTAANEYLALTPERFRKELKKLSPKRGRGRWRDDPALMRFLAAYNRGQASFPNESILTSAYVEPA